MRDLFSIRADVTVELIEGSGGVFEITVGGVLAYSKKASGRFPNDAELDSLLARTA